jgi:hypothetical protein
MRGGEEKKEKEREGEKQQTERQTDKTVEQPVFENLRGRLLIIPTQL